MAINSKTMDFSGLDVKCDSMTLGGNAMSGTELGFLDGVTAGTATASKALVVDTNKDIATIRNATLTGLVFAAGGTIDSDSGTATATAAAATLSKMAGVITTEALTTAAAAAYTLTLTNTTIAATDMVFASVANGTNSAGIPIVGKITPGAGSCTIGIENQHTANAFNGTLKISFLVIKA